MLIKSYKAGIIFTPNGLKIRLLVLLNIKFVLLFLVDHKLNSLVLPSHDSECQPFCCHCLLLIKNYEAGTIVISNLMQNSLSVLNWVNLIQWALSYIVKFVHSSIISKCIRQSYAHTLLILVLVIINYFQFSLMSFSVIL